jgi:hypothetical protein
LTPADPLGAVGELLDRLGIPHALIGGHAVNVWLEPRATLDVDVTVVAGRDALARLAESLREAGFRLEREHGRELPSGPDFQRWIGEDAEIILEIQLAKTPFQVEVVRRAHPGTPRVATPEDLIVLKLIADRPKDQGDLAGLIALDGLDWSYVERWADAWGVTDRLDRVRRK